MISTKKTSLTRFRYQMMFVWFSTSGTGTAYRSVAHTLALYFAGLVLINFKVFVFCFVDQCLSFFFWSLYVLPVDIQFLITILISSKPFYTTPWCNTIWSYQKGNIWIFIPFFYDHNTNFSYNVHDKRSQCPYLLVAFKENYLNMHGLNTIYWNSSSVSKRH